MSIAIPFQKEIPKNRIYDKIYLVVYQVEEVQDVKRTHISVLNLRGTGWPTYYIQISADR